IRRTPIPTVLKLGFSSENSKPFGQGVRQFFCGGSFVQMSGLKANHKRIFRLNQRRNIYFPPAKSIIRLQYQTVVKKHLSIGVYSFQIQKMLLSPKGIVLQQKSGVIVPMLLRNPLQFFFIISLKRVRNQTLGI